MTLRTGIACAELSSFPDICRSPDVLSRLTQLDGTVNVTDPSSPVLKASIWIQFCLLERILGVLLNLPSTTRDRPLQLPRYLLRHNGAGRELFWALSNIAMKIRDRDNSIVLPETNPDWIAETEVIERELRDLADNAGICAEGLEIESSNKLSEHSRARPPPLLHQHIYFYLLLRTHLPLMMQGARPATPAPNSTAAASTSSANGPIIDDEALFRANRSRSICIHTCAHMGRIYMQQIAGPSCDLFPMRISDFMAFTAIAVLLLEQEGVLQPAALAGSSDANLYRDTSGDARLLEELIAMLKQAARQEGRVIAVQAVKAIDSIRAAFTPRGDLCLSGTIVRIPLLGTMRVTKKRRSATLGTLGPGQHKRLPTDSLSDTNINHGANERQYQATPTQVYVNMSFDNTGSLTSSPIKSSAGLSNQSNLMNTSLQKCLNPAIATDLDDSPETQSRICRSSTVQPSVFTELDDNVEESDRNGDQYDWLAEMINTYDAGTMNTQDALWFWDDSPFDML